jgi:hypothetical protein
MNFNRAMQIIYFEIAPVLSTPYMRFSNKPHRYFTIRDVLSQLLSNFFLISADVAHRVDDLPLLIWLAPPLPMKQKIY